MKGSLPAARQAETLGAVVATLSQCLDLDPGTIIPDLRKAEEVRDRNTPAVTDTDVQTAGQIAVEELDEAVAAPNEKTNGKSAKADNDISDLLPVSSCPHKFLFAASSEKSNRDELIVGTLVSEQLLSKPELFSTMR